MLKPTLTLSFAKDRKADKVTTQAEPTPNYVEVAEEAISRIGKKLVLGAVAVVATYVILTVAGTIVTNALDTSTD